MGSKRAKRKLKASKGSKSPKKKNSNLKKLKFGFDLNKCQFLNTFSKIRENYFKHLCDVIKENVESANNQNLQNASLEKISLEIEQPALLACMQSEIYQQMMIKIIHDIKNSTEQMKLNLGIKKILLSKDFQDIETSPRLKRENRNDNDNSNTVEEARNGEVYSHIPTISSIRANYNENNQGWCVQNLLEDEYGSFVDVDNFPCQTDTFTYKTDHGSLSVSCEPQDIMPAVYLPSTGEQYVSLYNSNNSPRRYSPMVSTAQSQDVINDTKPVESEFAYMSCNNLVPVRTIVRSEGNYVSLNKTDAIKTEISNNVEVTPSLKLNSEESLGTPTSVKQLENSLEAPPIKDLEVGKEERERPETVGTLENASDYDTDMSVSLSDNYYDETHSSHGKHESLLADRLEEMREMFGIQNYEKNNKNSQRNDWNISEAEKYVRSQKIQKYNAWYHEKTMNLYRLSRLVSELTPELRKEKRNRLFEYFGEDSDEENETGYVQEEKFLLSCKERISHWVVKYLMPFYQSGRIIGRNVFKILGHHVSDSVIRKTPYPDECTVKYVVSKYFTADKSFMNESDVLSFQLEY